MEGPYVYLWLIHIDKWQNQSQYCKVIVFQLNIKLKKNILMMRYVQSRIECFGNDCHLGYVQLEMK